MISSCCWRVQGSPSVCVICGEDEHGNCTKKPKCVHFGQNHPSTEQCDIFLFEMEVQ